MTNRERASALCVHEDKLLMVKLRDPVTKDLRHFPPGGSIEPGETAVRAAEREAFEETGYTVRADPASEFVYDYPFTWGGVEYQVRTRFFRAALTGTPPVAPLPDPILEGVEWVPLARLPAALCFHAGLLGVITTLIRR